MDKTILDYPYGEWQAGDGGGWMGTHLGYEATMLAGGGVTLVAALYMSASPIRDAR